MGVICVQQGSHLREMEVIRRTPRELDTGSQELAEHRVALWFWLRKSNCEQKLRSCPFLISEQKVE